MSKLSFEYTDPVDPDLFDFRCNLRCDQCAFIKADGTRCRNRVCIGYPLCWIHTKKEYALRVKDSTIEGAGKGLFSLKELDAGEWICPYVGESISEACLNNRYGEDGTAPYAVQEDDFIYEESYIDSACVRGVGAMANGLFRRDGVSRTEAQHNTTLADRPGYDGIWLKASRAIAADEELFVYYGDQYRLQDDHRTRRTRLPDNRPC